MFHNNYYRSQVSRMTPHWRVRGDSSVCYYLTQKYRKSGKPCWAGHLSVFWVNTTLEILFCCPCFLHKCTPIWRPNPTLIHSSVEGIGHLQNTGKTLHCFKNGLQPPWFHPNNKTSSCLLEVSSSQKEYLQPQFSGSCLLTEIFFDNPTLHWDYDQGTPSYVTGPTPESWPRNPGTWSKWWRSRRDQDTPQQHKLEGCVPQKQVMEVQHPLSKGEKA